MTLHEFVAAHCPEGPAQLRRLILERTGVDVPYPYVWKWCNTKKLCAVSVEHAQVLHAATQGKCSLTELQSLKAIRARIATPRRKQATPPAAKAKRKPKKKPLSKQAKLRARIAELEQQLAAATSDAAADAHVA